MDRLVTMVCTTAAVGCCATFVTGCGDSEKPPAAPPAGSQQRLDLGVVGIDAQIGDQHVLGSGFVIDGDRGLVLTAAHSVWGARSLKLTTGLGVLHGRIVARAPCDDLALLELHPRIPGLAPLPTAPMGAVGDQLLRSIGRRRIDERSATAVMASLPVRTTSSPRAANTSELPLPSAGIPLDSPLVPEVSGGPVVDQAGRLVGMAQAKGAPGVASPGVTVPWTQIRQRLNELKPGPQRVFVGWAQQYRCVGRQHAYARAMHPGYRAIDARLNRPIKPTRLPGTEGMDG
jgi:S1-C subfamily serine protease